MSTLLSPSRSEPSAAGIRGRMVGLIWRTVGPFLQRQLAFNSILVDHINRNVEAQQQARQQDEAVRRARIVAGRYQAMLMSGSVLPWRSPVLVWQVVSHKFLRPLVPFLMIIAFLVTLAACIWQLAPTNLGWLYLAAPYNILFLIAEILICILAIFGSSLKDKGLLGKILYLPTFLVNSNLAAILGLYSFFTGKQTSLWRRARRRGESV